MVGAAMTLLSIASCASGDDLPPIKNGETAGTGWVQLSPGQRQKPLEISGQTFTGEKIDLEQWRGSVVVLNTWYADCAPCRKEAPVLQSAADHYADAGVHILGVNVRGDSLPRVQAFQKSRGVSYESIDDKDGTVMLALRGVVPNATPVTLVLDDHGSVAAKIAGEVDFSTLDAFIENVLAERSVASPLTGPAQATN